MWDMKTYRRASDLVSPLLQGKSQSHIYCSEDVYEYILPSPLCFVIIYISLTTVLLYRIRNQFI